MNQDLKFKQGFLRNVALSARMTRWMINLWPPFVAARIHIEDIGADYRSARVRMRQWLFNTNLFGTHFGGSLFAMTDPFYAMLIMHNLGTDYVIWDRASTINFKLPAKGVVRANFSIDEALLDDIRAQTAGGAKYEPVYAVDILNQQDEIVATVTKTIYIRRKPVKQQDTS